MAVNLTPDWIGGRCHFLSIDVIVAAPSTESDNVPLNAFSRGGDGRMYMRGLNQEATTTTPRRQPSPPWSPSTRLRATRAFHRKSVADQYLVWSAIWASACTQAAGCSTRYPADSLYLHGPHQQHAAL
ncbi:hypothetical protein V8D89_015855 [Ganoderma adspersum]